MSCRLQELCKWWWWGLQLLTWAFPKQASQMVAQLVGGGGTNLCFQAQPTQLPLPRGRLSF